MDRLKLFYRQTFHRNEKAIALNATPRMLTHFPKTCVYEMTSNGIYGKQWGGGGNESIADQAFKTCLAALSLALKGHNVDRCFWGIGPGGVGQSLYTAHLDTVLGGLHAYLDTNIYYTDDEQLKQADQPVGCVVDTRQ